jgi:hypothetical protein
MSDAEKFAALWGKAMFNNAQKELDYTKHMPK